MGERIVTGAYVRVWLATLAAFVAFGITLLAVPLYARDELAARDFAIGVAVGAASVSAVLLSPVSGRIADRHGRRVVLVAGALVMVFGYLALLLDPPLAALTAIRLCVGGGEAAVVIASFTVVADLAPEARRGEAMSLVTVASYGGLAFGPFLGDLLIGDNGRFDLAWLTAAGCAAIAAALGLTLPETRPAREGPPAGTILPPRSALAPALVLLLALVGFGGFNAFAALYAREIGVRPGIVYALFGLVVLLVRAFGRRIPDRFGGRSTATGACVTIAAGLAVMALWGEPAGLLIGTIVFAIGQSLAYPAVTLLAIARTPEAERSAAIGAVGAAVDSALGLGAFALGTAAEVVGYDGAFLVAGAIAAAGVLVLARLGPARVAERPLLEVGE
jgi:MFS family permease